MNWKRSILLFLLAVLLAGTWLFQKQQKVEDALPPMVMVEGILYQLYDFQSEAPEGEPDGMIRKVAINCLPTENGQATFGEPEWPYWKTGEGICVYGNENYLLFKVQE